MNRRQILGFAAGPLGAGLLSAVSLPLMTWIFPPDMIGRLSMLQVATSLFTLLCCLGLDQAYVREFHESPDRPALFLNAVLPGLCLLVVFLVVLMVASPSLLSSFLFNVHSIPFSIGVVLCLVAVFLSRFLSLILRMQDRGLAFSMSQLFSKMVLLLIVLGYVVFATSRTFTMLLTAQVSAFLMTFAVFAWNTRRDWWPAIHSRLEPVQIAGLLGFGWPLVFGGVASWGLSAMDRVFLRSMSTYDELAVYSVASSIASAVTVFAGIFNIIWSPMVYRWVADKADMKRVDAIASQMTLVVFLIVCFTGGSSWILSYLLPPTYAKVPYIVVGCIVSPLLYTLSEVTGIGIAVTRKTTYSLFASLGAVVLNIFLCYLLVPHNGANGAMIASVCAFGLFFILRTEFSAALWCSTRRLIYYIYTGAAAYFSVAFAWYGYRFQIYAITAWWLVFIGTTFYNRSTLSLLWRSAIAMLRGTDRSA